MQTSEGLVLYVRCAHCGVRRVDRRHRGVTAPGAYKPAAIGPGHVPLRARGSSAGQE
jgi:hypothetical protein